MSVRITSSRSWRKLECTPRWRRPVVRLCYRRIDRSSCRLWENAICGRGQATVLKAVCSHPVAVSSCSVIPVRLRFATTGRRGAPQQVSCWRRRRPVSLDCGDMGDARPRVRGVSRIGGFCHGAHWRRCRIRCGAGWDACTGGYAQFQRSSVHRKLLCYERYGAALETGASIRVRHVAS